MTNTMRTPTKVADGFEPLLKDKLSKKPWGRHDHINCICESKDEAVLVAHELGERGWKAKPEMGIDLKTGKALWCVLVTGPKAKRA